ncbi:MAG: hypothetical protein UD961_04560 [Bacteroidales bacterium]|nr:hypothetical protein [Bacteroidales bacterium]
MAIDTLLPKKLNKVDDPDSYKSVQELNEVLSSAEKHKIRNVALTGPFGSGKSSVLVTLMKDFSEGRNYLPISLATLQANEEDNTTESDDKTSDDEKRIENLNRKIEYSILQQLIYREKAKTVPNSRFRRIVHLSKWELIRYPLYAILSLICFFILFEPSFARVDSIYNFFSWGETWNVVFDFIAAGWLLFILFIAIRYVFRSYSNSKLNKLNLKDAEIEVVENNSMFNRHLDEILYFFQVTKYDVVIIEDLDRFGTPNIFLKLRELNQLINESKIVGRHITFVYAVKDDIFKDEERTKFFDYIITIIPVINPSNSKDKLKAALKANGCEDGISDDDLSEMAFFIQDMRILTNIVNEYKQYRDKLCTTNGAQLSKTKLLGMIVYKNYYPQDFALLHHRDGKVYQCLSSKRAFIKDALSKIEERKKALESKKQVFLNSLHLSLKEVRLLYLYQWKQAIIPQLVSIQIDNHYYTLERIADSNELFDKLISMTSIQYRHLNNYSYSSNDNVQTYLRSNSFFDREQQLKSGDTPLKLLEKQIREDEIKIKSLRISELLRQYDLGETETYKNIGLSDMQDVFLRLGYIDEDYYDYISYFYPEMVSLEDREFLLNIKRQIKQPYDYHIDRIKNVVKELKEYMFESDAILNIELLDYLATTEEYKGQFEHIMSRLERDMAPLQFLSQYYTEGKQCQKVFEHYIENVKAWDNIVNWSNAEEKENLIEAYLRYSTNLDEEAQKWLNCNYEFLVDHLSGVTLDRALALIPNSCFVDLCEGSVDLLDCIIERGHYVINLRNLTIITKHLNKGDITITENTLNYTRIKDTGNEDFIAVVNDNISMVFKALQNTNKDDSADSLLYILNSADIELNDKKLYLSGAVNHIDDFSGITDSALYNIAIATKIVLPTWQNVLFYYDNCSDETREIFYDYINHYAEELSRDTNTLFLKDRNDLYVDLFGYNQLSIENYKKLLPSFAGEFPQIELLADLEHKRLNILISSGRVPFSQQVLAEINKTNALAEYISFHTKAFMQQLDWEYNFNNRNVQEILNSGTFSIDEKYNIIGIIPFDIIQSSQSIANIVVDTFCKKQKINLTNDSLIDLVKASSDINKKLELIVIAIINDCHDHIIIRQLLNNIGDLYIEVGEKSKKPLLPNDILHRNLLDALMKIKFISSYKEDKDDKFLRVHPTKTTYIGFIK